MRDLSLRKKSELGLDVPKILILAFFMDKELINFLTGCFGFGTWVFLTLKDPPNTLKIAVATLIMMIGFSGSETIISIVKSFEYFIKH